MGGMSYSNSLLKIASAGLFDHAGVRSKAPHRPHIGKLRRHFGIPSV